MSQSDAATLALAGRDDRRRRWAARRSPSCTLSSASSASRKESLSRIARDRSTLELRRHRTSKGDGHNDFPASEDRATPVRLFTTAQLAAQSGITAFAFYYGSARRVPERKPPQPAAGDASSCASARQRRSFPIPPATNPALKTKSRKRLPAAMERKVQFVWSEKPAIYAVRDQLDKKLCDVVVGIDNGDDRVLTTRALLPGALRLRSAQRLALDDQGLG